MYRIETDLQFTSFSSFGILKSRENFRDESLYCILSGSWVLSKVFWATRLSILQAIKFLNSSSLSNAPAKDLIYLNYKNISNTYKTPYT